MAPPPGLDPQTRIAEGPAEIHHVASRSGGLTASELEQLLPRIEPILRDTLINLFTDNELKGYFADRKDGRIHMLTAAIVNSRILEALADSVDRHTRAS